MSRTALCLQMRVRFRNLFASDPWLQLAGERPSANRQGSPVAASSSVALPGGWHWVRSYLFDPYRPELHYMRGAGPKWRTKHARSAGSASSLETIAESIDS